MYRKLYALALSVSEKYRASVRISGGDLPRHGGLQGALSMTKYGHEHRRHVISPISALFAESPLGGVLS